MISCAQRQSQYQISGGGSQGTIEMRQYFYVILYSNIKYFVTVHRSSQRHKFYSPVELKRIYCPSTNMSLSILLQGGMVDAKSYNTSNIVEEMEQEHIYSMHMY